MSRIRSSLSAAGVSLAVVLAAGCSSTDDPPVVNISNDATGTHTGVVVSGKGEVSGAPDTVAVSVGVTVKRDTAPQAITDAAGSATALIDALKAAGVAEKDIQTTSYSINQEFRYPQGGSAVPDGWRVTNQVIGKVRKTDAVGAVIDAATTAGGSNAFVQGISFSLDDDTAVLSAAREKAFADAKAKAEQFAELSGRKLGKVESISQTVTTTPPQATTLAAAADSAQRPATPIQPGEVETAVTVDVRWSFDG